MARGVAIFLTSDREEFQLSQAAAAKDAAHRLGLTCEVFFAESNAILQIHQLFQRIHQPEDQRPLALVVDAVRDECLERVCRNAVAAGVGWLPLNRDNAYVADLRRQYPTLPVCHILTDQIEAGRVQQCHELLYGALLAVRPNQHLKIEKLQVCPIVQW